MERGDRTGNCCFPLLIAKVVRQVGILVFFTSLSSAHSLSTGGLLRSSCSKCQQHRRKKPEGGSSYGNRHQQTRPLDLAHMGNGSDIMSQEAPDDLPVRIDDADVAIVGAEEEAFGPGYDA